MNTSTQLRKFSRFAPALCAIAAVAAVLSGGSTRASQYASDPAGSDRMLLAFTGKGTLMAWDVGVIRAAYEALPAMRDGRVILSGSSSGSILAAAMSCRGFNEESLAAIEDGFRKFNRTIVDESATKNLMVLLGLPTEAEHSSLDHLLDVVLDGQNCIPRLPMLIPAGNFEMLDVRSDQPLRGRPGKTFNVADFTVSEGGRNLGKACTYFVDRQMLAFLQAVPREELLCDLRLIETNADLRLAVLASVSEPTYFHPFRDPAPGKIIPSGPGNPLAPVKRSYWGGAIMDVPVHDIKRALPGLYTFATGRAPFMMMVDKIMSQLSLIEITPLAERNKWWLDLEVTMTAEMGVHLEQPQFDFPEQIAAGYEQAKKCLASDSCLPAEAIKPENTTSPANHPSGITGDLSSFTRRGLGGLAN
ncbi:MAG: hypothetical protein RIQ81_1277 [Pseudomonadota bacterium]